ncbi:DNA alkylation repair protein [Macrococcus sp. DPC7161]|uniref:DNA alkylation repair protein n=1 Tax=Macrococcus sp. DPC7161 TaxID=2507060 RepID=UPI00100B8FFE|nr:DNA alkylation repair protein [Macrococcus sp. DPC7161]RXK18449.1 DNA alkylation repair protein [Macrococcus sp. DPC7161]
MEFKEVMDNLEALGKERTKKIYMSNGAVEPLFGVTTGSMKPMRKAIKKDQALAEQLYETGNYDAMYFAGVIADPQAMTKADFNRWMDQAYFYMISDYVVAVTLSESDIAQEVADEWLDHQEALHRSGGWCTYTWLLGHRKDDYFDKNKIMSLMHRAKQEINDAPERVQIAIKNFIVAVGVSYLPLHEEAIQIAQEIGVIVIRKDTKKPGQLDALSEINKAVEKDRIGFKRRYVRC